MPIRDHRPLRRSKRFLALLTTCAAFATAFLGLPSSAGAYYEEPLCGFQTLWPGGECFADNRHTLQEVQGWSVYSWQRVCAASFSTPWGVQNSDWRCDYGTTLKSLGGRVDGVGGVHNGDPLPFMAVGIQRF